MSPAGDEVLEAIHGRRSVGRMLAVPVPREAVEELIAAAVRAPNHHLTFPWRFVVLAGAARREVGEAHARAVARARPGHPPEGLSKEAARLERAPVVVAVVVARPDDPATAREDRDAVAAGVQNMLLAAHARGLGAMWRTGLMAEEAEVHEALGMGEGDELVGFVYMGLAAQEPPARERPHVDAVTVWRGW